MSKQAITKNKFVTFICRILDEQQQVVEQSDIPFEYHHGVDGKMFKKVEQAMEGKITGDQVSIALSPEESFGQADPDLIFIDRIENVPPEYRQIGTKPTFQNDKGETREMTVTRLENGEITIDGNHPFAGKNVTFIIDVISVLDSPSAGLNDATVIAANPGKLH